MRLEFAINTDPFYMRHPSLKQWKQKEDWSPTSFHNIRIFDENYGTRVRKDKDPMIVKKGPMIRSRVKKVKETMGLLVQSTVDETSTTTNKMICFMLGMEGGTR